MVAPALTRVLVSLALLRNGVTIYLRYMRAAGAVLDKITHVARNNVIDAEGRMCAICFFRAECRASHLRQSVVAVLRGRRAMPLHIRLYVSANYGALCVTFVSELQTADADSNI